LSRGPAAFDQYYAELFQDEWPRLKEALLTDSSKTEVKFAPECPAYLMDPASVHVAQALEIQTGETVLDMCAAPGGKSLVLLRESQGKIHLRLNDLSVARVERLKRVLQEHLPADIYKTVRISRGDAISIGIRSPSHFDRILLDAPCSGERHLLNSPKHLQEWTLSRSKNLARRQYGLLCSAALALKPGGRLVYSTCTLNKIENEDVIERFMKRKPGELAWLNAPGKYFRPAGVGPMYFAVLVKPN
jgi:5-methylcytosine rRNA methyltransferase NSUN4